MVIVIVTYELAIGHAGHVAWVESFTRVFHVMQTFLRGPGKGVVVAKIVNGLQGKIVGTAAVAGAIALAPRVDEGTVRAVATSVLAVGSGAIDGAFLGDTVDIAGEARQVVVVESVLDLLRDDVLRAVICNNSTGSISCNRSTAATKAS